MEEFQIVVITQKKKDGSEQDEQVLPQTSIKAVIGLDDRLQKIERAIGLRKD
ncbi:hypothetical protein M3M39_04865 [Fructilactobacillus hinvesii]|uniref:Uncharacterized protein n=1 Tax=Fructilactobacillus hinvesii TaxID=2940300 RepID=A0ABY5BS26_9LACO|nr:hypothetical protein [Fructilactobacillus hinvesii]USS87455.1 hypothetical protein M3M39_04865 [Fructilactobacillus hinvesii]